MFLQYIQKEKLQNTVIITSKEDDIMKKEKIKLTRADKKSMLKGMFRALSICAIIYLIAIIMVVILLVLSGHTDDIKASVLFISIWIGLAMILSFIISLLIENKSLKSRKANEKEIEKLLSKAYTEVQPIKYHAYESFFVMLKNSEEVKVEYFAQLSPTSDEVSIIMRFENHHNNRDTDILFEKIKKVNFLDYYVVL